jgi:hypothetical protein
MIKELTEIRNELLTGLEKRDRLYIKIQINKIDTLLYNASKNNCVLPVASERTLGINSCAALIKSMPTDQAIQIMKSDITGQPQTVVIEGELVVAYVR